MREKGELRTSRSKSVWRGVAVTLALLAGWMLPESASEAQAGSQARARACRQLQAALNRVGNRQAPRQALISAMNRLGCNGSAATTTSVPATTTTSIVVVDCPLPGGGVGPCPTSTITTVSPPTTQPGDTTTTGPSTTLPPCSTTTTLNGIPPTTIPCQP